MEKNNIESYLREHGELTYHNKGVSMLPMLKAGRDLFHLQAKSAARCKKYDVVLYRRGRSYVLHRIVEVRPDDYVILGDNCANKEYGITDADILGVLSSFVHNGREISADDLGYQIYAKVWYRIYPIRRLAMRVKGKAGRVWRRLRDTVKEGKKKAGSKAGSSETVAADTKELNPITKDERDLFYLLSCVLHGIEPDSTLVQAMNLPNLYALSCKHYLGAMVYKALKKQRFDRPEDAELMRRWQTYRDKAIRKIMLMDAERAAIYEELDKAGIWHVGLKGIVLKDAYPQYGMREMSDNDILFDGKYRTEVRDIMVGRGFAVKDYDVSNHDIYEKPPVYNFEMHVELMTDSATSAEFQAYFNSIEPRLVSKNDGTFEKMMSPEDFYLFIICHAFKHFDTSGTGFRSLVDVYLCDTQYVFDREKVESVLNDLGVDKFEKTVRSLAHKLLGQEGLDARIAGEGSNSSELSQEEASMLCYMSGSGVYGTMDNLVSNKMAKMQGEGSISRGTKLKYVLGRIFVSREFYKRQYPLAYKYPVLLPGLWIFRAVRYIVKDGKRLGREIAAVLKA